MSRRRWNSCGSTSSGEFDEVHVSTGVGPGVSDHLSITVREDELVAVLICGGMSFDEKRATTLTFEEDVTLGVEGCRMFVVNGFRDILNRHRNKADERNGVIGMTGNESCIGVKTTVHGAMGLIIVGFAEEDSPEVPDGMPGQD